MQREEHRFRTRHQPGLLRGWLSDVWLYESESVWLSYKIRLDLYKNQLRMTI